jgi:hypothetical protein
MLRIALGPEERNDFVATQPAPPRDGEQRKQGEGATVPRRAANRAGIFDR